MTTIIEMPSIFDEEEALATAVHTLGFGPSEIRSKVTVGRSDVMPLDIAEIKDKDLRDYLSLLPAAVALARITLRLTFRPRSDEKFENTLFSVLLSAEKVGPAEQPFARLLVPRRLVSGPFTLRKGLSLKLKAGIPGAELEAGGDWETDTSQRPCYVIARGEGESDPEWGYTLTPTMQLDGSHEMGFLAQYHRGTAPEVQLMVQGTVRAGRHRRELTWRPPDHIASFTLEPADA